MKSRLFNLALALVLILTSVVTGTLANAVESANDDQNLTQTSGENVKIEQATYARGTDLTSLFVFQDINGVKNAKDCGQLTPAVYDENSFNWSTNKTAFTWTTDKTVSLWDSTKISNVVDQLVMVKNVGTQAVNFRTVFAFEADTSNDFGTLIHKNLNTVDYTWSNPVEIVIDGVTYEVIVATYNTQLAANTVAPPSLLQIALDKNADNADVAQFGVEYEIKILTQASDNDLTTVFGTISAENHPWIPDSTATD